jgi:Flp pilus assembly protein TadG
LLRRFARDERGVAAVEMALIGGLLTGALMNVAEVGRYAYLATEVSAASQAAAQAAIITCPTDKTPVTINCPAVAAAVTTALHGSSLGSRISLVTGGMTEGWYCLKANGTQVWVSAAASKPANCIDAGEPNVLPALYVSLQATYDYEAMFPGLTIVGNFPPHIIRTSWMRML